jgi:hypothetical protein
VGRPGFEPGTSRSQTSNHTILDRRASALRKARPSARQGVVGRGVEKGYSTIDGRSLGGEKGEKGVMSHLRSDASVAQWLSGSLV